MLYLVPFLRKSSAITFVLREYGNSVIVMVFVMGIQIVQTMGTTNQTRGQTGNEYKYLAVLRPAQIALTSPVRSRVLERAGG